MATYNLMSQQVTTNAAGQATSVAPITSSTSNSSGSLSNVVTGSSSPVTAPKYDQQGMLVAGTGGQGAPTGTPTTTQTPTQPVTAQSGGMGDASNVDNPTPTGLQMPTGTGAKTVFDPISGQQVTPQEKAFNQVKASKTPVPDTLSGASDTITTAVDNATPPVPQDNSNPAVDAAIQNNPNLVDEAQKIQDYLNPTATTDQLNNELTSLNADKATLVGLNTQYMNIQNVMAGTESDIRTEIQAAGGMGTNSQIMALTAARNKVLLQQSKTIQESIANQKSIIANDTSLYNADKAEAQKQYTDKSNALKIAEANQKNIDTAAKGTYSAILKGSGGSFAGLYATLQSDPSVVANAERVMGLQPGQLEEFALNGVGTKAPTVTDVTYDASGNKITTKNGVVTSTVQPKPKVGTGTGTGSGGGYVKPSNEEVSAMQADLTKVQGADKGIAPADYNQAYDRWTTPKKQGGLGHTPASFKSLFGYLAKNSANNVGKGGSGLSQFKGQ